MGIIRSAFPHKSKFVDRLFLFITSSVVFKFVVIPGGLVYRFSKGLPSGHPLTSILGSIVNWLIWSTILCNIYDEDELKRCRIICQGDDTVIRVPINEKVTLIDQWIKKSGMDSDSVDKSLGFGHSTAMVNGCKFLKKRFRPDGLPFWDLEDVFNNIETPNKEVQSSFTEEDRMTALFYVAPFDSQSTRLIESYRQ